jgi:hypothetical protein
MEGNESPKFSKIEEKKDYTLEKEIEKIEISSEDLIPKGDFMKTIEVHIENPKPEHKIEVKPTTTGPKKLIKAPQKPGQGQGKKNNNL